MKLGVLALALVFLAGPAVAQTYVLRGFNVDENAVLVFEQSADMTGGAVLVDMGAQQFAQEMDMANMLKQRRSFGNWGDGLPGEITVEVLVNTQSQKVSMNGNVMADTTRADDLQGRTVTYTSQGDTSWVATMIAPEDTTISVDDANPIDLIGRAYLATPVSVGDSWEVDAANMVAMFGGPGSGADIESATMTVTFDSVATYNGMEVAALSYAMNAVGLMQPGQEGGPPAAMQMEMETTGTIYRTLDTLVDVYMDAEGAMNMGGQMEQGGQSMTLSMEIPLKLTRTVTFE